MSTISSEPFWRSKPLQLLVLVSAAAGVVLSGEEQFDIPLGALALALFVLSAVFALIAMGAEAAKDFDLLSEHHRKAALRRASGAGQAPSPRTRPIDVLGPIGAFIIAAVAIVLIAPLATNLDARGSVVLVSLLLLGALIALCTWFICLMVRDSKAIDLLVDLATAVAFGLALLGVATPMVSYVAREVPQIDGEPDPPEEPTSNGNVLPPAYGGALSDRQVRVLADAIRSLRPDARDARMFTDGQVRVLADALRASGLSDAQFASLLAALNARDADGGGNGGNGTGGAATGGDASVEATFMSDAQVHILAAAIRDSRPAPVHVSVDATSAAASTTTDNSMWRIDHPPRQRAMRRQCTFPRPATP